MKVPRFTFSALRMSPEEGTTKEATAATAKASEPAMPAHAAHHVRASGSHRRSRCVVASTPSALATRKQTDPSASGRHTWWRA